jgi:DNA-binding NtrC family response regulator
VTTPTGGNETILLVEDKANLRQLTRNSLERAGYTVHEAENGSLAQSLIETNGHIDIVVSDIVMAGGTGFDLVKWLQATRPEMAILLISGYPHPNANGVLEEFDVPFLKKPFHPLVLVSRVREVLDAHTTSARR